MESDIIAMRKIEGIEVHLVPRLTQPNGHITGAVTCGERLWVGDICIVFKPAIFCKFEIVCTEMCMKLVTFSDVCAKQRTVHFRVSLSVIIATSVEIIEDKTKT